MQEKDIRALAVLLIGKSLLDVEYLGKNGWTYSVKDFASAKKLETELLSRLDADISVSQDLEVEDTIVYMVDVKIGQRS